MNINNYAITTGRLAADPKVFTNKDGSRKVRFTLACEDNYTGKDGQRGKQFIQQEAFIRAGQSNGVYDLIHEGDLVETQCTLKNNNWTGEDGTAHYDLVLQVEQLEMREPKSVTEKRHADKAAAAADA